GNLDKLGEAVRVARIGRYPLRGKHEKVILLVRPRADKDGRAVSAQRYTTHRKDKPGQNGQPQRGAASAERTRRSHGIRLILGEESALSPLSSSGVHLFLSDLLSPASQEG